MQRRNYHETVYFGKHLHERHVRSVRLFFRPVPTFESAMEEAHKQFKEEAKTYRKSYGAENITTEECYRDLYIKGPDFIDWWTVVEVPTTEEENK